MSVNPDDFIITRKRKKYRFAKFANSPLCFEVEEWRSLKDTVLPRTDVVEIGAGTGLFSVELAGRNPDKQFVAIDVKGDRLQKGALEAEARGLTNIRFLRARADQLHELFSHKMLETIWITFPDPFPKQRAAGRRLTHPNFLAIYEQLLADTGKLHFKSDARELFLWSLEQFVDADWQLQELSFDLHESSLSDEYKIMTTYEVRWTSQGIVTNLVTVAPPAPGN